MAEDLFKMDFGEVAEFDNTLDINKVFEDNVKIAEDEEDDTKKKVSEEDDEKSKKIEEPILEVNKVLESSSKLDDVVKKEEVEDKTKLDDGSPAHEEIDDSPSSEKSFTVIFAKDLSEQGLLSSFDEKKFNDDVEEHGEAGALRNLIQKEVDYNIETAKKDYSDGYQEYLQLVGKGVAPEQAGTLLQLKDRYGAITEDALGEEENEELRREVLTQYFQFTTQMSEARIKKFVDKSFDMGDDVTDAKEYLVNINEMIVGQLGIEQDRAVANEKAAKEESQRQLTLLRENIDGISEIIPGQRINKQTKDKMYDSIVKPIRDERGNVTNALWQKRAEDSVFFDSRLAYLLDTGFFEKGKTWDKLKNVKTTKEASQLEEYLSKAKNTKSSTGILPMGAAKTSEEVKDIIKSTGSILN